MKISIDEHSGFCFGVTRAIQAAESELEKGSLYCLGDIVHNGQEVARLEQMGLQTIDYDDLRTLPSHSRVLLRAHGEPPSTYWIAQQRGIEIIDATCPVVKKLQDRIRACYEQHKNDESLPPQIVIYGKPGHAEVIGLQGQTNNTAIVIENTDLVEAIEARRSSSQNHEITRSREDHPAPFEYHDTICRNVANRVKELQDFARSNDIVFFVGGTKSSNARVLYNNCIEANPNTFFISSPDEVEEKLSIFNSQLSTLKVGICGATSTPLWLMEKVRDKLADLHHS